MKITERIEGEIAILEISGDIFGGPDFQLFKDHIYKLINQEIMKMVVELSRVKRINSTGLGILMSGYTSVSNKDGIMVLANASQTMKGIMIMTKLNTIFKNYESVEEAIAALK